MGSLTLITAHPPTNMRTCQSPAVSTSGGNDKLVQPNFPILLPDPKAPSIQDSSTGTNVMSLGP